MSAGSRDKVTLRDCIFKLLPMVVRGLPYYLLFRSNKGLILIGKGVRIRNPSMIHSAGRLIIEDYAEIQGASTNGIKFGKNVSVGSSAVIRPSGYYNRQKGYGLEVGDNSNIGIGSYIGCGGGVVIGNSVMMGPHGSIHSENHNFDRLDQSMKSQGVDRRKTTIEDDVWLAAGVRILSGVTVGASSVVAAGAVVTQDVGQNTVTAGVPARAVSNRVAG